MLEVISCFVTFIIVAFIGLACVYFEKVIIPRKAIKTYFKEKLKYEENRKKLNQNKDYNPYPIAIGNLLSHKFLKK